MKLKLMILFLAISSIAFAQKKEMRKIQRAIEKGELKEAQDIFNTINEDEVEDKYAAEYNLYKAGSILGLAGARKASLEELREAESTLMKAQELGLDNSKLEPVIQNLILTRKFELANEYISDGKPETALKLTEELYDFDKSNLDMLYNAGNIAYNNQLYDKAIEKFKILIDQNYTGVSTSYLATNKQGVVEKFPNKLARDFAVKGNSYSNPTSETTPSKLGDVVLKTVWLLKNKGEVEKALSTYQKAIKDNPNDNSLKLIKADVFLTLEMMEEYQKAIENTNSDITDPAVFDNLGIAAFNQKNYDSAIRYFESSLDLKSDNYGTLINLANSYLEKGNLKETTAEEQKNLYLKSTVMLEKAHKLKPEEKAIVNTLVSLFDFLGMKEKAEEMKAKM